MLKFGFSQRCVSFSCYFCISCYCLICSHFNIYISLNKSISEPTDLCIFSRHRHKYRRSTHIFLYISWRNIYKIINYILNCLKMINTVISPAQAGPVTQNMSKHLMFYVQNAILASTVVVSSRLQQGEHTAVELLLIIKANGHLSFRRMCLSA